MSKRKSKPEDALQTLFELLTDDLVTRIRSGEATPAEKNIARQILRDNGITAIHADGNDDAPINRLEDAVKRTETAAGTIAFPFPAMPSLLPQDDPVVVPHETAEAAKG